MKRTTLLLSLFICSLLFLLPFASAACKPGTTTFPTPTPYPPGPYGTISVESSPAGASIYLDGDYRGRAPLTITDLWPKSYEITAKMSGYETFTSVTTISGPTRASVYCRLTPESTASGIVVISSPAKATVFLDGAEKGVTPLTISDPATGSHTIQLRLAGYEDWKSVVDYHKGTPRTVSATLKKKDINTDQGVSISSGPAGASVTLDGLSRGKTPLTLNDIAAGIHVLQLDYPGYKTWKSTIDVPENEIKKISVTLDPKPENLPGWIAVSSSPGNASVTVDGNYIGRTPATGSMTPGTIAAGEHTVTLELTGYKLYSTRATVSPNLTSTVNAVLVPTSARGSLSVTSDPAGAEIAVDNRSIGVSPLDAQDIAAGYHIITMKKDGYQDYSTSFHITAGMTSTVSATLEPVTSPLHSPVSPVTALGALGIVGFLVIRKLR